MFIFAILSYRVSILFLRPITQEDIARKLNVTRITVSKALRDHTDISAAMKERVRMAAEEMGYTPNQIAQQLANRITNTIGVIVPDLENSFFSHVADSIIDAATDKGFQVLMAVSREKVDIETQNIRNLIGKRVDGLMICLSQNTEDPAIFEYVRKLEIPLVFFDRSLPVAGFSSVVFDDVNGARLAIDRLSTAGYSRIAHFSGYSRTSIGQQRLEGFKSGMIRNGLLIRDEWIIEGGFEVIDGYQSFLKLHKLGNLPEIILAANDRVALGAYRAIREKGLKIPDDIGVVGFGFPETTEMFNPPLSIVSQDPRKMGQTALIALVDEIRATEKVPISEIRIAEDFIWNDSVRLSDKL